MVCNRMLPINEKLNIVIYAWNLECYLPSWLIRPTSSTKRVIDILLKLLRLRSSETIKD
jgi:hypothetical protein